MQNDIYSKYSIILTENIPYLRALVRIASGKCAAKVVSFGKPVLSVTMNMTSVNTIATFMLIENRCPSSGLVRTCYEMEELHNRYAMLFDRLE